MYRLKHNRVGIFLSKMKNHRKSRYAARSPSLSHSRAPSNIGIESVPYSLSDDSFVSESSGAKVPATIQSSTTEVVVDVCISNARTRSRKVRRSKCHEKRYVASGESIKEFPVSRKHCLFDEANPIVAYFSDATLYSIPEDGAGLCRAKYFTVYPYKDPDIWSDDQSNNRPHHRRSSIVYS